MTAAEPGLRLDKWLWFARFFKTRSLATAQCQAGRVRIDGEVVSKPHAQVRPGHVLTFVQANHVRIVRVSALPVRRGAASEAQELYEDLSPPVADQRLPRDASAPAAAAERRPGSGRPTKKERHRLEAFKEGM